jgi:diguanylate cyclase (GGDEF)-like protein/PAS domain S-box-containing protein
MPRRRADLPEMDCGVSASEDIVRRYGTLVQHLPLVIYVDALDDASSNIYTSPGIEPMLGYSTQAWQDDPELFVRTLHPDDRDRVLDAHAHTHRTHEALSIEYRLVARDGEVVWVRDEGVVVCDDDGTPLYLQGYLLDITAEREAQDQLRAQALFDPLTGLANRAFFHEQLEHALALRREDGAVAALIYLDLDEFKAINDQHGHAVGDEVLATLGERIQSLVRAGDSVARLGGDEFAILLASIADPAEATFVAERLLRAIAEPITAGEHEFALKGSVGIALGDGGTHLLKQADAAMYRAKAQPDSDYAFYDDDLDRAALERFKRIADLRRALDNGEFVLAYQPVVMLDPVGVTGFEALLRWEHPELGEVPPLDFISLAEECGLIVPIGRWVLREACAYAARVRTSTGQDLSIAVNVSARQLQCVDFLTHVDEALTASSLPADKLTLELTESVLVAAGDRVERRLAALKRRGVCLALDDFGTGYASLAYLQRLPVDVVKIDRSFTAKIDSGEDDLALLRGIVGLGKALGLQLVAEGIERVAQEEIVQALGCDGAQGFYFGRPEQEAVAEEAVPTASEAA